MATAASGANFVRYFFYANNGFSPLEKQSLVALAYSAARDLHVAPSSILIRSALHPTTSYRGRHIPDPKGWHATLAIKTKDQGNREVHVASYGYTAGKGQYELKEAVHKTEKPDDVPRGAPGSGKVVWPDDEDLEEYENSPIAHSHIVEQEKSK